MYTKISSKFLTVLFTSIISTTALAQNVLFLKDSPLAQMDETDRQIMRATIDAVLSAPDGTATDWLNPESGSKGKIEVIDTHQDLGTTCRNIRMIVETKARKGGGNYRLCLANDGTWKFAPNAGDQ